MSLMLSLSIKLGHGAIAHLALEGENYKDLIFRLKQLEHPYREMPVPLSNEWQVFIAGPDSLMVEMLFSLDEVRGIHKENRTSK